MTATKAAPAKAVSKKRRPPEEFIETAKPVEVPPPPEKVNPFATAYPAGTRLFWYQPEAGGDKIPLPLDIKNPPDKLFYWELHQVKGNAWVQMASYMDRFEVPKTVQRHVFETLPDPEFMAMCNTWFEAMGGGATAGE